MQRLSVFQKIAKGTSGLTGGNNKGDNNSDDDDGGDYHGTGEGASRPTTRSGGGGVRGAGPPVGEGAARPSYRAAGMMNKNHNPPGSGAQQQQQQDNDDSSYGGGGSDDEGDDDDSVLELDVQNLVAQSAGAIRLNRILRTTHNNNLDNAGGRTKSAELFGGPAIEKNAAIEKVSDPSNLTELGLYAGRRVVPPLRVDPSSIGGTMLDGYPQDGTMIQECLLASRLSVFESTGTETVTLQALQYPHEYSKHKRSLGLFGGGAGSHKRATKLRYVLLARSTNRPLLEADRVRQVELLREKQRQQQLLLLQQQQQERDAIAAAGNNKYRASGSDAHNKSNSMSSKQQRNNNSNDDDLSERDDYDTMFSPDDGDDGSKGDLSYNSSGDGSEAKMKSKPKPSAKAHTRREATIVIQDEKALEANVHRILAEEEEISSFPVLVCMTLHSDGSGPDIRKLIPLDLLTTVQDLHSTVVQLAFRNGDTVRLDFGTADTNDKRHLHNNKSSNNSNDAPIIERPLDKERFIWSLLQIHSMLCLSVVERNSAGTAFLPPLNIRNMDRAELQYVATVNHFLPQSETLRTLLERHRKLVQEQQQRQQQQQQQQQGKGAAPLSNESKQQEATNDRDEMDALAYDLMMGNYSMKVTLFHSEEERKDAEEILNANELTDLLMGDEDDPGSAAASSLADRLRYMLQSRMRDLEAETCRRLIAWEDEKQLSSSSATNAASKLHGSSDARDTVDALALASLFKTLESLDGELRSMEEWLQDRAAAIKPLTDDCADIEEENRQLEQQWKSYDMLGAEMRRLLESHEIDIETEKLLKNPASALVYDDDGLVDVDESEDGIEQIYAAGKALLEAMEFPRKSGGMHLKAVSERARGLTALSDTYCSSLAQIIVTVMEQFKTEVVAGSDNGKVSKNDTHTMIAKKIRDTQRKFQSALLGYIKLIEILAALSPGMLPALRDAYAEMVAEGILMKKRMKGYFQALPGKNSAYTINAGKNLKDYTPFQGELHEETVNGPDIRAVMSELLPVIAREAYFTSALFGSNNREQDGREKKRNFENAKNAVDKASTHFRYYVNRTCGIADQGTDAAESTENAQKGDALLCLVATICLNEAMDNYIDREKKGGDHSLSLAYVRATILDLRKKADKQWVAWVDRQLEWIRSNDGVPVTGKRAGIFPSFARFPVYLDHVIMCCKEGREPGYIPDLPGIKVIHYYMQKMAVTLLESLRDCATRETTDQSYAANVMQMENTYFFTQSIKDRGEMMSKMFAKQVTKANAICKESTDAYLGWMIKREFTALHELFSRVSRIRKEMGDNEIVQHVPKAQFLKIIQKEANREVLKEKIGALFSRMEKHLSEEGDLLPVAWKALVKVLFEWFGRWEKLCSSIYRHKLDPSPVDIVRIAKAAGGQAHVKAPVQGGQEFGFKTILALGNKQGQGSNDA